MRAGPDPASRAPLLSRGARLPLRACAAYASFPCAVAGPAGRAVAAGVAAVTANGAGIPVAMGRPPLAWSSPEQGGPLTFLGDGAPALGRSGSLGLPRPDNETVGTLRLAPSHGARPMASDAVARRRGWARPGPRCLLVAPHEGARGGRWCAPTHPPL